MHIRSSSRLGAVAALAAALLVGCAGQGNGGSGGTPGEKRSTSAPSTSRPTADTPSGNGRSWEPDDALQRAQRALDAYADDGTHPKLVDSDTSYIASGADKTYEAPGDRPYRLDLTCDTRGVDELTLTLSRGEDEQAYGIGCGDPEADQFNIPSGTSFKISVDPVKDGTGLVLWRLSTIAPDDVEGCDDDITACED
ncbi:hypothetical protein ABZ791_32580 [Streptomyces huasconensis]|uniref:Lipoprotein n=1 Tax=Streptomyces huasconensis TaxID=1854574 RepID=A0ABV3M1I4_9ACTN